MFTNRILVVIGFLISIWSCNQNKNTEKKALNIKPKTEITKVVRNPSDDHISMNPYPTIVGIIGYKIKP